MALHVVKEAQRCLNCKVALCSRGCPINTPIPAIVSDFLNGEIGSAGEKLFKNNPLSLICSLICDHEKQCEGHCVLGRKSTPIHFSSIEHYISENYFDKVELSKGPAQGKRVAVIGSGPAGITIAIILASKGYDITIFESRAYIGGVLRFGIPEFRLPKIIIDKYRNKLIKMGIKIRPNTTIGGAIGVDDLFRDGYSSVFIGTGVWRPKTLGIKGETLGNVQFALDYLCNPEAVDMGDSVIIIGGGNSAMDVARVALRKGVRNVTIFVRSDKIAASSREIDYAKADGVEFKYFHVPIEITDKGVLFCSKYDGVDNVHFHEADSVVIAVSQGPKDKIINSTTGIEVNTKGLLVANETGHTTREGIFASGDVVLGAKTVVEAVRDSKIVAESMHEYMQSLD